MMWKNKWLYQAKVTVHLQGLQRPSGGLQIKERPKERQWNEDDSHSENALDIFYELFLKQV